MPESEYISVYDVATLMGCSCASVRRLIKRGVLQGIPLPGGRKLWLRRQQVEAAMAAMQRTAAAQRAKSEKAREKILQLWLNI